jgi:hypothetical protein
MTPRTPSSDLKHIRVDKAAEKVRVELSEVDQVKSLQFVPLPPAVSSTGLVGIKAVSERRKKRHDAAVDVFERSRRQLYDAMEEKVGWLLCLSGRAFHVGQACASVLDNSSSSPPPPLPLPFRCSTLAPTCGSLCSTRTRASRPSLCPLRRVRSS